MLKLCMAYALLKRQMQRSVECELDLVHHLRIAEKVNIAIRRVRVGPGKIAKSCVKSNISFIFGKSVIFHVPV